MHLPRLQNWPRIMGGNGWRDQDEERIPEAKYLKYEKSDPESVQLCT